MKIDLIKQIIRPSVVSIFMLGILLLFNSRLLAQVNITHGPMVGSVAPRSAKVWLRTSGAATVKIEYSLSSNFVSPMFTEPVSTTVSSDYTAKLYLAGLAPLKSYYYRIYLNDVLIPEYYKFCSGPEYNESPNYSFAVITDFEPYTAPAIKTISNLNPAFVCIIGDLDHRNPGADIEAMRTMRKELRSEATGFGTNFKDYFTDKRLLSSGIPYAQIPVYYMWDDHDYGENNADKTFPGREDAVNIFHEYFLLAEYNGSNVVWQQYKYGKDTDIFLLDVRSHRDKIQQDAPEPDKSTLGILQKEWLKTRLVQSSSRWKFIISGCPFNPGTKTSDAWGHFTAERRELVDFIKNNNITGVIFVTGDIHSGGAIDDGTNSDFPEVSVPHCNLQSSFNTFGDEPGTWTMGPLNGRNNGGFVLLDVTPQFVEITVRDKNGAIKTNSQGMPFKLVVY